MNYARINYWSSDHHRRYRRYIESMPRPLVCQDCSGRGGYKERVLDDGSGPWYDCGWCEGTGYVTRHVRGLWLREMRMRERRRQERKERQGELL